MEAGKANCPSLMLDLGTPSKHPAMVVLIGIQVLPGVSPLKAGCMLGGVFWVSPEVFSSGGGDLWSLALECGVPLFQVFQVLQQIILWVPPLQPTWLGPAPSGSVTFTDTVSPMGVLKSRERFLIHGDYILPIPSNPVSTLNLGPGISSTRDGWRSLIYSLDYWLLGWLSTLSQQDGMVHPALGVGDLIRVENLSSTLASGGSRSAVDIESAPSAFSTGYLPFDPIPSASATQPHDPHQPFFPRALPLGLRQYSLQVEIPRYLPNKAESA
ncbi:hypothetical protein DSO57_1005774 [Entomophthora muscae]|uniref:Uncharacterized protein n=1 Tax=Entomophthora muscae TaxID=34485 RepID=A0ACC2SWU0_9FUNG|nr:hypothetical protein DSO57_1005774 [Entomophthora muscae]